MKVVQVKLHNFQAARDAVRTELGDMTVLIGRNDVGKSTFLKALDHFLNDSAPSGDGATAGSGIHVVSIELTMAPAGAEVVIDEAIPTTLEAEELLDADQLLRVEKQWDVSISRPKAEVRVLRKVYADEDFLLCTEAQLVRRCKDLGIETTKANGEEFNNVEKRTKLRARYEADGVPFDFQYEKLSTSGKSRSKKIYDAIRDLLPRFEYFRADTSLDESDTAIQRYLRDVAVQAINEMDLGSVEEGIREQLGRVLDSISERINRVVPEDERVVPDIEFDWSRVAKTSFKTEGDVGEVPLSRRGDGFRRVAMMAYFEHLAEDQSDGKGILFGFEEPETFLHPSAQEALFGKLRDLSEGEYQVVVSTHSPILVASSRDSELVHVVRDGRTLVVEQPVSDLRQVADDIGVTLRNQFLEVFEKARVLLLVEGIDDAQALSHVATVYSEAGLIDETFDDLDIVLFPIGGKDSIQHWVSLDLISRLNKPVAIWLDSDKTSLEEPSPNRESLEELDFQDGADFLLSRRRTLENYISCDALNRLVTGAELEYGAFDDVKDICRRHPLAGRLGGKNVVSRHFSSLVIEDLQGTFCDGGHDEFLALYELVVQKRA